MSTKKRAAKAAKKPAAKAAKKPAAELDTLPFASAAAWHAWLAKHHASSRGLWLKIAKKASGIPSVAYPEIIDVAISWGWIDGVRHSHDDTWYLQKLTPRTVRSIWSKINRDKALAQIAAGTMQPAGLAEVERARKDGRWEAAYDGQKLATVPDDLARALAAEPRAAAFFATLDSRNRYAVLFRLHGAKKAATRAARLARFVDMLARKEKFYP